jgi:hypothetical protein
MPIVGDGAFTLGAEGEGNVVDCDILYDDVLVEEL